MQHCVTTSRPTKHEGAKLLKLDRIISDSYRNRSALPGWAIWPPRRDPEARLPEKNQF